MTLTLTLRRMRLGEEGRLYEVLRSAVIDGAFSHYDDAQRRAWAPSRPFEGWVERLAMAECFVCQTDDLILGFMSVTPAGHVDLAYVRSEFHGAGIGHQLLDRIDREMRLTGVERMTTGASLVAEPFFARHGWHADGRETVERNGQKLTRVRMSKSLKY